MLQPGDVDGSLGMAGGAIQADGVENRRDIGWQPERIGLHDIAEQWNVTRLGEGFGTVGAAGDGVDGSTCGVPLLGNPFTEVATAEDQYRVGHGGVCSFITRRRDRN